ncbi:hypothetical protein EON81_28820 [bacterium]|nr:MAG: hypothetical protein EON81_28820 [bacterium]
MKPLTLTPLPEGTQLIDSETQEAWVVAYCEAMAQSDAFGPYAYGCINEERDERVVFHSSISIAQTPAVILPR